MIASDITGKTQRYLFGWNNQGGDNRAQTRGSDEGLGFIVGQPEAPNATSTCARNRSAAMYNKGDIQSSKSAKSCLSTVLGHDDDTLAANSPD